MSPICYFSVKISNWNYFFKKPLVFCARKIWIWIIHVAGIYRDPCLGTLNVFMLFSSALWYVFFYQEIKMFLIFSSSVPLNQAIKEKHHGKNYITLELGGKDVPNLTLTHETRLSSSLCKATTWRLEKYQAGKATSSKEKESSFKGFSNVLKFLAADSSVNLGCVIQMFLVSDLLLCWVLQTQLLFLMALISLLCLMWQEAELSACGQALLT